MLTFFGFIHGEEIGVAQSPVVALSYLGVAAMLFGFDRYAHVAPAEPHPEHEHGGLTTAAGGVAGVRSLRRGGWERA